jgi:hypothetical protein
MKENAFFRISSDAKVTQRHSLSPTPSVFQGKTMVVRQRVTQMTLKSNCSRKYILAYVYFTFLCHLCHCVTLSIACKEI